MPEVKYTVELEVADEIIKNLTTARLSLDDLVQTKIETALFPLTKGAILVYRAEGSREPINKFQECPTCHHTWAFHFQMTDPEGKKLLKPEPSRCGQCPPEKPCEEALK
jgi:hypothetical protein